uniref:Uncharacterized protein n=1 Tax=Myoviridae sp. ctA4D8 TaxID=2823535 RepID=A0A8S5L708_9CAUD|nr:MAG TPA: hypothetical protein [Myoviridae sp. ctA4D8]
MLNRNAYEYSSHRHFLYKSLKLVFYFSPAE